MARASLGETPPAFGVLIASAHFQDSAEALLAAVTEQTGPFPLIGCVAEAVVGGSREVESGPAVSLWLAADVGPVETFSMGFVRTASGGAYGGYRFEPHRPGVHLMICDPFTFPADYLLSHLNADVPGTQVMGGMASGGVGAGEPPVPRRPGPGRGRRRRLPAPSRDPPSRLPGLPGPWGSRSPSPPPRATWSRNSAAARP